MKRRVFIAINLPERVKDRIEKALDNIRNKFTNDIRFIDRKNWHITLSFLGWQEDESIGKIIKGMEDTAPQFESPRVKFADIDYGPKGKTPRMIWFNGSMDTSEILEKIKKNLETSLMDRGVIFAQEHRKMNVHITLAKFRSSKNLPEIKTDLGADFIAEDLDLMESHLARSGANYEILQSMKFRV